ncbi:MULTISPECIES: branched-chain amino acid ABC transporter permease [unclassified Rhizobium]|uniref:branched-chain amino acid ABC transporter permease n=1 Tax=unclassified Rhizobium TaxID=2613769 RepID=UPI002889551F|nr:MULTISPECIES: branched-chain amino acid ABC transporter permease [unclassified Rhizobium]
MAHLALNLSDTPPTQKPSLLPFGIFICLALVPFSTLLGGESYLLGLVVRVMIFAIAAMSLDLLVGYGSLVSFGHAAFIGIGSYTVGIFGAHGVSEIFVTLPSALALSAFFALISGFVCLRTKGTYFIMITLAFAQMLFFIATSLAPYGGDDGLTVYSRSTIGGVDVLGDQSVFYYFVFGCLLLSYLFCHRLVRSRFGRVFRGAKENATRISTLGFEVYRFQLLGYVISGTIAGLAGFLLANATNFVSPAYMSWQRSGELLLMIIIGGSGTLNGAILGSATFILLEEWLSGVTEHWKMILGPILVVIALVVPGGLIGIGKALRRRFARD